MLADPEPDNVSNELENAKAEIEKLKHEIKLLEIELRAYYPPEPREYNPAGFWVGCEACESTGYVFIITNEKDTKS